MGKNSLLNKAWGVKGNKLKVAKVTAAKKRGGDGLTDSERALAYTYHVEVSQQGAARVNSGLSHAQAIFSVRIQCTVAALPSLKRRDAKWRCCNEDTLPTRF